MKLISISLILSCLFFVNSAYAQEPFVCDGAVYFIKGNASNDIKKLNQLHFNWVSGEVGRSELPGASLYSRLTSIGYNPKDNFIYAIGLNNGLYTLVKIDKSGNFTILTTLDIDNSIWTVGGGDCTREGELVFLLHRKGVPVSDFPPHAIGTINLNSVDLSVIIEPIISHIGESSFFIEDISFDPITDSLFTHTTGQSVVLEGGRLLYIDRFTPLINDTAFPLHSVPIGWAYPFFDTFGNLWAVNYWLMIKINKNTGTIEQKPGAMSFYVGDICSCPYTLSMQKTVSRDTVYPCSEVNYILKISNLAKDLQEAVNFRDSLPSGFQVLEILRNPYGGNITGIGSNILNINNMNIPYGIDSIIIKVLVPEGGNGLYLNQAQLSNVDLTSGNNPVSVIPSDYPFTGEKNDPTPLYIEPFEINLSGEHFELCPDSIIILDPLTGIPGLAFLWNTGSTDSSLEISEPGNYSVTVTAGCKSDSANFEVLPSNLSVDLGESEEITYGDILEIQAIINSITPITTFAWQIPDSLTCSDCPIIEIAPEGNTTIELTVKNEAGCYTSDSKFILVDRPVFIPNVFSPNNDGINDVFFIQTKHPVLIKKWQIFNRWGDLVFTKSDIYTNDASEGWDGRFKEQLLERGVYVWQVELEYSNTTRDFLSGDLLILGD
jgi:gliding motility-associated-like protein